MLSGRSSHFYDGIKGLVFDLLWLHLYDGVISGRRHHVAAHSLSYVWLFATPWTIALQAPLSNTMSWSWLRFMSIELVMLSHPLLPRFSVCLQSSPASGSFPRSQVFASGGPRIGASASASVLPMNSHSWFPLGLTGLISLQSKGLSRVLSNTTIQKHQFFGAQLS